MSKSKMLQEAIADAKAVKETAMANAKAALEEAFTPRLQSMISAKLQQEMDDEDMEGEEDEDFGSETDTEVDAEMEEEMGATEEEPEMEADLDAEMETEVEPEAAVEEDGEEVMGGEESEDEEDLELEAIIRELEGEMGDAEPEAAIEDEEEAAEELGESDDKSTDDEDSYGDIDINEIIAALREDLDDDGMPEDGESVDEETEAGKSDDEEMAAELEEAYKTINIMRSSLNETNLLNAKLLFSNKLFKAYDLNESQKLKVIDNFDRAETLREVKLVYATLAESMKAPTKRRVSESASKTVGSTAPRKEIISESGKFSTRMQQLAGIKKNNFYN